MSGSCPVSAHVCRETARERDEARAEVERLRAIEAGVKSLAEDGEADGRGNSRDLSRSLRALLNPTEGDRDE